jgi:hypothetical protein
LKKCQKVSYVSLGRSWRAKILHEHALLVAASNYINRFGFLINLLKSSFEKFCNFLEKMFLENLGISWSAEILHALLFNLKLHNQILKSSSEKKNYEIFLKRRQK